MEPKDDGKRTKFSTGAVRSDRTGRGRYDLISPHGLKRLAVQYEEGAKQKGERNWEKGFPISRACCSAIGHIFDHLAGDRSEDHFAAASWQMFCAMHFEELIKLGKLDASLNDVPGVVAPQSLYPAYLLSRPCEAVPGPPLQPRTASSEEINTAIKLAQRINSFLTCHDVEGKKMMTMLATGIIDTLLHRELGSGEQDGT